MSGAAPTARGHHRQAGGHGFEQRLAEPFRQRREDEQVGRPQRVVDLLPRRPRAPRAPGRAPPRETPRSRLRRTRPCPGTSGARPRAPPGRRTPGPDSATPLAGSHCPTNSSSRTAVRGCPIDEALGLDAVRQHVHAIGGRPRPRRRGTAPRSSSGRTRHPTRGSWRAAGAASRGRATGDTGATAAAPDAAPSSASARKYSGSRPWNEVIVAVRRPGSSTGWRAWNAHPR